MARRKVKYMTFAEFCNSGLVDEVNRVFFHPMGLSLEFDPAGDDTEMIGRVWDNRKDQLGIYFSEIDEGMRANAMSVAAQFRSKAAVRERELGAVVQPLRKRASSE